MDPIYWNKETFVQYINEQDPDDYAGDISANNCPYLRYLLACSLNVCWVGGNYTQYKDNYGNIETRMHETWLNNFIKGLYDSCEYSFPKEDLTFARVKECL